jgi:WD40 repeat protein
MGDTAQDRESGYGRFGAFFLKMAFGCYTLLARRVLMPDLFISYSRKDMEFVHQLCAALSSAQREVWVDWRDIPPTAEWLEEIKSGIEGSDNFLFVISPDSIESAVCQSELSQAVERNKRLIPILHRDVPSNSLPAPLAKIHFIFFRNSDDFQSAFAILTQVLDDDLEVKRRHTRLLVRAREWGAHGHHPSLLLRGRDLQEAQEWQAKSSGSEPQPTPLHAQFILASSRNQVRRQRLTIGAIAGALLVTVLLSIVAWNQRNSARRQASLASARYLASQSEQIRGSSTETSALLAVESARTLPLLENNMALQKSLRLLRKRMKIIAPGKRVFDVSFSADGRQIATGGEDGADIYEVSNGKDAHAFRHDSMVGLVALSPDGRYLATASKSRGDQVDLDRVRVIDLASGKTLKELKNRKVTGIVFSPDGKYFAAGGYDLTVPVLETSGWNTVTTLKLRASAEGIAFSPDSLYIAIGGSDFAAHIFQVKTGSELFFLPHPFAVSAVAFSPDERYLVTAGLDKQVRIFDLRTRNAVTSIAREESPESVKFSPDGRLLATGDLNRKVGIFEASGSEEIGELDDEGPRVQFSPDGLNLATTNSNGARFYSNIVAAPKVRMVHDVQVYAYTVSKDQSCIASTSDGALKVSDWQGHLVAQSSLPDLDYTEVAVSADCAYVAVAVDETGMADTGGAGRLLLGDSEKAVLVFDIHRRAVVARLPYTDSSGAVSFHPGGRILAIGSGDGLRMFEIPSGKPIRVLPLKGIGSLSFSSDGRYLATTDSMSPGSDIQVLEFSSGKVIWHSHQDFQVWAVAISPDGRYLAAGAGDAKLRIYNVGTGQVAALMQGAGAFGSVAFSADGGYVAAGSTDRTASVFEIASGTEISRADCSGETRLVQFSVDDKYLVCVAVDARNDDVAVASRQLWRTKDLENAVCSLVTRNLYDWEWRRYFEGKPRKTCAEVP